MNLGIERILEIIENFSISLLDSSKLALLLPLLKNIFGLFMITFSNKDELWTKKFNNCIKAKTCEEEFIALLDILNIEVNIFETFVQK